MNERIELVSDREVTIRRMAEYTNLTRLHTHPDGLGVNSDLCATGWDADGLSALIDCLNCYRDTKSFAALADTSAVPYANKCMRDYRGYSSKAVTKMGDGTWLCLDGEGYSHYVPTKRLRPLTPAPPKRYRPMTPVEAAKHIGRSFNGGAGKLVLHRVGSDHITTEGSAYISLALLCSQYSWTDDGSKCGIEEGP